MEQDPHIRRLLTEQENLLTLASSSDLIKIEPIKRLPGMPPDKYIITFTCKGIIGINKKKEPIVDNFHQVLLHIWRSLTQEPDLRWLTPIWHPNIKHKEPRDVCTNKLKNYFSAKGLNEVVVMLGKMVQYKIYFALWQSPWPDDKEVADWVLDYAEPHGIIGPNKPFDDQPLLRENEIRSGGDNLNPLPHELTANNKTIPTEQVGIKVGEIRSISCSLSEPAEPVHEPGIIIGTIRNL